MTDSWAHPAFGMHRLLPSATRFVVDQQPWNVAAGLTFKSELQQARCHEALRRWLRLIARDLIGAHVPYFFVSDRQQRGAWHFHALLALPEPLTAALLKRAELAWRSTDSEAGIARVERVADAAAMARYLLAGHATWNLNVACDRHLRACRRTCRWALGSWRDLT